MPRTYRPCRRAVRTPVVTTLAVITLAGGWGCRPTPTTLAPLGEGTRMLFVGNSQTYVHDLPAIVSAIARQLGDSAIVTRMVAAPDFSLDDHWSDGSALDAIRSTRWDFVVMQQGPSSLPENQLLLEQAARRFAPSIGAAGGEAVLYQVWPHVTRRGDAPAVFVSYRRAALAVGGRLAAAGSAWDSVFAAGAGVPMYANDGLHASPYGTWLAAVMIYAAVRGRDPLELPPTLPPGVLAPPLPEAVVQDLLARASGAWQVVRESMSEGAGSRRATAPRRLPSPR